jgi:2-haloacid dehalogenase
VRDPRPDVVVFDVVGTLFGLGPVEDALTAEDAPAGLLEAWFERLLHSATSLTLAGEYAPFSEIARSALATACARFRVTVDADSVMDAFGELPLLPGAQTAVERLASAGVRVAALTNSGAAQAGRLLGRAALLDRFEAVLSVEATGKYKPHPAPYRYALEQLDVTAERAAFVAAHAWDVLGADRVGLRALWVASHEGAWPLPIRVGETAPDLEAAARLLLGSEGA